MYVRMCVAELLASYLTDCMHNVLGFCQNFWLIPIMVHDILITCFVVCMCTIDYCYVITIRMLMLFTNTSGTMIHESFMYLMNITHFINWCLYITCYNYKIQLYI